MPSFCSVPNCRDKYKHSETISFHRFPLKRKELLQKWLKFVNRSSNWKPSKWSSICSRHFCNDDFNSVNERKTLKKFAVPSVNVDKLPQPYIVDDYSRGENTIVEGTQSGIFNKNNSNTSKSNCRLCGVLSDNTVTFETNFEIYGLIQKCLPILNIQQSDGLPKEMCRLCLNSLQNFSRFIDIVLDTQTGLQKIYFNKNLNKNIEKQLKIKQEPVVGVKQEISDHINFSSDEIDLGVDENCDNEPAENTADVKQKYDLYEFPVLNSQDIINNCDIMEIINLDEPFINIPDDEGNTSCADENLLQHISGKPKYQFPTAHELLQTHLLFEEHNYAAIAAEDFIKNEIQLKCSYKIEKNEISENNVETEKKIFVNFDTKQKEQTNKELLKIIDDNSEIKFIDAIYRSSKPIVTSVSSISGSEKINSLIENTSTLIKNDLLDLTENTHNQMISFLPKNEISQSKPNIVVLNESIVKSSAAFQLHACTICQVKFFSLESLTQHYSKVHFTNSSLFSNAIPMVTVPNTNLSEEIISLSHMSDEMYKSEYKENGMLPIKNSSEIPNSMCLVSDSIKDSIACNKQKFLGNSVPSNGEPQCGSISKIDSKDIINVLEIHQTFSENKDFSGKLQKSHNDFDNETHSTLLKDNSQIKKEYKNISMFKITRSSINTFMKKNCKLKRALKNKSEVKRNKEQIRIKKAIKRKGLDYGLTECNIKNYSQLNVSSRYNWKCRKCKTIFPTFSSLSQHKYLSNHHFKKNAIPFAATCNGCEKFFWSKIALKNHMRYICQSISLRWFGRTQWQQFKCRWCQSITFTHWRIYRRHEILCSEKFQVKQSSLSRENKSYIKHKKSLNADRNGKTNIQLSAALKNCNKDCNPTRSVKGYIFLQDQHNQKFSCKICSKSFSSLNSLNQHNITHSQKRIHNCVLCNRSFKRRNGLTQHVKGFHLKLKPFQCSTCLHSYALKCDMFRCRHSALHKRKKVSDEKFVGKNVNTKIEYNFSSCKI